MVLSDRPTVFIASSSEHSDVADHICLQINEKCTPTHWKDAFRPGLTIFENLMSLKDSFDFAIIVINPDDIIEVRGEKYIAPRDNVVFELGLFLGAMGAGRVFAVLDGALKVKLPTDYSGVVYVTYDGNRCDHNLVSALRPACVQILHAISRVGGRHPAQAASRTKLPPSEFGLGCVYKTYAEAERDILNEFMSTEGPIRLFLYVASQNVGVKGPLLDAIDLSSRRGVEVRIMHSDLESSIFDRNRLIQMGKDPDRVRNTLSYVSDILGSISEDGGVISRRAHDLPFIWRMYAFPSAMYIMPYFSQKDAVNVSPVLKFSNNETSMYKSFIDLFDYLWRSVAPKKLKIADFITSATPCGTALIVNWQGRHVFAIPSRDVESGSDFVRFYGIGGKRDRVDGTLEDCALREGREETGDSIESLVSSATTEFVNFHGRSELIELIGEKIVPRIIIEKRQHSGVAKDPGVLDKFYYTFCYYANMGKKPRPTHEVAALLFLDDEHLKLFRKTTHVTVGDLIHAGAELDCAENVSLSRNTALIPHGTAVFLINKK